MTEQHEKTEHKPMQRKKSIFNWNHISKKLNDEQITELKEYYHTYHKKCWAYKQAVKNFKKWRLFGNSMSVIFASGGIATSIATGGIALVAVTAVALLIQGWMKHNTHLHLCLSIVSTSAEHFKRCNKGW